VAFERRYFPAFCRHGHGFFLAAVSAERLPYEGVSCEACGRAAQLLPAAYYVDASRHQFDRVARVIESAELSPTEAASALERLNGRSSDRATLEAAYRAVPKLALLRAVMPEDERRRLAFIGLVVSLLSALVSTTPIDDERSEP
jgi:hypothetical protein